MTLQNNNKIVAWLALLSGLSISAVAVYYSVAGLVSIFAAAAIPIMIMGVALEVSKLVATVWLKQNWSRAPRGIKAYLTISVVVLMLITSMGIFGFLSKAHLDQAVPTGDVAAKVAILDEKIATERDNINAARKALAQMDSAVDQTMSRSTAEQGADKAVAIRRSQAKERTNLQNEIATAQKKIAAYNEERAPIASELRKVEAEVGPIKYIAKLIYGDNPDANILEKAVTWVIMIIIVVFDPLAVLLLLASQLSFGWIREDQEQEEGIQQFFDDAKDIARELDATVDAEPEEDLDEINLQLAEAVEEKPEPEVFVEELEPEVVVEEPEPVVVDTDFTEDDYDEINVPVLENEETWAQRVIDEEPAVAAEKLAKANWKAEHPDDTLKHQKQLKDLGLIDKLPWEADLEPKADYSDERPGDYLPADESKKKDNMDGKAGQSADNQNQGAVGYVQNAEQGSSTLWQRVHKQ